MLRLDTLQSLHSGVRCAEGQRRTAMRKRPHLIRLIVIHLAMIGLLGGLLMPTTPAFALSGSHDGGLQTDDPGSYNAKTGNTGSDAGSGYAIPHQQATALEAAIISTPWAPVDSNGVPGVSDGDIPGVYVVEAAVRNAGSTIATDVVVTLNYNPTGDWVLLAGEDPVRMVEELAPGETYYAYWFAGYPSSHLDLPGSHQYSVTASAANASSVSTSQNSYEPNAGWTVQTRNTISTGNSGVTQTIADIVVGVELNIIQDYDLGTNPGDITFSPVGNDDFAPRAYRLLTAQVRFFDDENTQEVTFNDRLYFPESDVPGFADQARITYTFLPVLLANTTLCPYAAINFSSNAKYDLNYCSDSISTRMPISGTITLSLTKQVSSQTIKQGQSLTYTIAYANNGDQPLQYAWVWDDVPAGVSIDNASISPASDPDETTDTRVAWNLGPIPQAGQPGSADTLTFSVLVDGNAQDLPDGTSLVNYAFFGISPGGLPGRAALTSTVTSQVQAPTIAVTKTDGRETVGPNELLTYHVHVTNAGASAATGVVITDVLPSDVTLAGSVTPSPDSVYGQTLAWNDVSISPGGAFDISIPVRVASYVTDGTVLENRATVLYMNAADHIYSNKTATDTTTVEILPTELTLTKTAEDLNGPPLAIGDAILYTLQVTNTGAFTAYNVSVTDDLPDLVTCQAVSGDNAPDGCADPLVWTIPSLGTDATASLYVTVTIDEGAEGASIVNTASVIGDNVPNPPDDPTPVCPDGSPSDAGVCPDTPSSGTSLALSKTAEDVDGPPVLVGDTIRYTLQVTNTGTYTAHNVIVTDDLPDQVTCQEVWGDSAPAGCADPLVWNISSLAPDATASLFIDVTINRGSEGQSIINVASVIGGNVPNLPDDTMPVCPDGSPPANGICEVPPEPAPGSGIFLPIVLKNSK
jgi:uncharacterized repeat protein (TIGR01451 family)